MSRRPRSTRSPSSPMAKQREPMRTRRELLKAALGTSVTLLVAACAGGSPSATRPAPAGGAPTAGATAGWEQVIAAAKQEGKLVVMSAPGADVRDALTQGFQSKYPEIELDFTGLRGGEAATKLFNERQAGQYRVDLLVHGTTTIVTDLMPEGAVDPVQPFLVGPDVQDASKWLGGRLDFADDDGKYDLVFITAVK